jgi:hypothetical protein
MKLLAKVVGTLACVLVISGIAVISPRAVHAVVATIIRDQDNPARHPFTTKCFAPKTAIDRNTCETDAIPAGEEVVVETISFNGNGDPGNFVFVPDIITTAAGVAQLYDLNPIFDSDLTQPTAASYAGVQSVRLYADPGSVIKCEGITPNFNPSFGLTFSCAISGYFVTLP